MIRSFTINNLYSFGEKATFSMKGSRIKEYDNENCFIYKNEKYLKINSIHGLNSAGKSNIIKALFNLKQLILNSHVLGLGLIDRFENFKFFEYAKSNPIEIEIEFFIGINIYRYCILINENKIIEEKLYKKNNKEILVFERKLNNWNEIKISEKYITKNRLSFIPKELKNEKTLLLTVLSMLTEDEDDIFYKIRKYIDNELIIINGKNINMGQMITHEYLDKAPENRNKLLSLMKKYSFGMDDFLYQSKEEKIPWEELKDKLPKDMILNLEKSLKEGSKKLELTQKEVDISVVHNVYDKNKMKIGEEILEFENYTSEGTRFLYNIAGGIFRVLETGGVLVLDESLGLLHTVVVEDIINLFNNKETNKYNAQLIFTGQNPYIMSEGKLRRDQITIITKDNYGVSYIKRLSEFKFVKTTSSFSKSYLKILRENIK